MYHAIISDFHLNPFKVEIQKLNFIKQVYSNPKIKRVTFNGDVWEGFGFKNPGAPRFSSFYQTWYLPFLKDLSKKIPTDFIPGNHDSWVWWDSTHIPFVKKLELTYGKQKFHITHGHQYALKQADGNISSALQDLPLLTVYHIAPWFINGTFGRYYNQKAKQVQKQTHSKSTALIIGHTHFFEIDDKNLFYNSGSNTMVGPHGLAIDTKTGKVLPLSSIL